uniref:Uncharacterized protein n=1 Tax=Nelumbo nucifera TaxID=4432 RepID=A0A822ZU55_NELNU|nr:TPA_asm: hypothetical protein HUJ06_018344 [Nelumbo nucifera]
MDMEESKEKKEIHRDDLEEPQEQSSEEWKRISPWTKQITIHGLIASLLIEVIYNVIVMNLNLSIGPIPNLNVSIALFAFVFIQLWTTLLQKAGIVSSTSTWEENTIIQICAVACYSIVVGGEML